MNRLYRTLVMMVFAVAVWGPSSVQGQTYHWTNTADGSWSAADNWTNGAPSASGGTNVNLVFEPDAGYSANNDLSGVFTNRSIKSLAGTVTLTGNDLGVGATASITNKSASLLTINNDIRGPASGNNTLYIGGPGAGGVTFGGTVIGNSSISQFSLPSAINITHGGIYSNASFRFEAASGTTGTISGVVRNCGTMDLGGAGALIFSGVVITNTTETLRIGNYTAATATPVLWRGTGTWDALVMGSYGGGNPALEVRDGGVLTVRTRTDKDFLVGIFWSGRAMRRRRTP